MKIIVYIAGVLMLAGYASGGGDLHPWVFPLHAGQGISCQILYSDKELMSVFQKFGIELPPHKSLNIHWGDGRVALAILTNGEDEPVAIGMADGFGTHLPTVTSRQITPATQAKLFIVEWDDKMDKNKNGKCWYRSSIAEHRACLSSGASNPNCL
jgi:hypothetical protein